MSFPHLPSADHTNHRAEQRTDLLLAYLQVARTAADRAQRTARCPDVLHLVECAQGNLAAAHDLLRTDREWAA